VKTILLFGKGPSVRYVPKTDRVVTVCLNNSTAFTDAIDYLVFNDIEVLDWIPKEDFRKISNVMLPAYPHKGGWSRETLTYRDILEKLRDIPYEIYNLYSAPRKLPEIPDTGRVWNVGETAVTLFLQKGYRQFQTVGIDPQEAGYHEAFSRNPMDLPPPHGYADGFAAMTEKVLQFKGTIERL
jgi:hypothetical protein